MSPHARCTAAAAALTLTFPLLGPGCSPARPTPAADDPALALVNGVPLHASDLQPRLLELAGQQAFREHVLDQMLAARRASVTVTDAMIAAELAQLRKDGTTSSPERLRALAERNATLRALSESSVVVTDAQVAQLHAIRTGPRKRVSVLVVANERDAVELLARLRDADDDTFAALARTRSIDASASQGGMLGPVSTVDPALPLALRNAIESATDGQTSGPILVPSGVALLRVHASIPASAEPFNSVSSDQQELLRAELRASLERDAMDCLADRLIQQASITIMDPALRVR